MSEQDPLKVTIDGQEMYVRRFAPGEAQVGSPWLKELYELFAPVREEAAHYTDEEINAAIDEAVRAVRTRYAKVSDAPS